jgi:hypothetical protein
MCNAFHAIILLALVAESTSAAEVVRSEDQRRREIVYSITDSGCTISWVTDAVATVDGLGVEERSKCYVSLERQGEFRAQLLKKLLSEHKPEEIRNYYWGSMQRGDANDEYSLRLAKAASRSKHWDKASGDIRRFPKGINVFVQEILQRDCVFSEITAVFASENIDLRVGGVEEVIVGPMPPDQSQDKEAKSFKYPISGLVTFYISKTPPR